MIGKIQYDLILLDLEMPEINGLATARLLKNPEIKTYTETPILAFSSVQDPKIKDLCKEIGMVGFLEKPSPVPKILNIIEASIKEIEKNNGVQATYEDVINKFLAFWAAYVALYQSIINLLKENGINNFKKIISNIPTPSELIMDRKTVSALDEISS